MEGQRNILSSAGHGTGRKVLRHLLRDQRAEENLMLNLLN
jgi:hypothetical protein